MTSWKDILNEEFEKDYFQPIKEAISKAYAEEIVYPERKQVFRAFNSCPLEKTRVVILGQDPYFNGRANGLCFSANRENPIPPSLRNIYQELQSDLGCVIPEHGDLSSWTEQGVLLINSALTVLKDQPESHAKLWEPFTKSILKRLNEQETPIVFLLWGNFARKKRIYLSNPKHLVLESGHPSPLSVRYFSGNKHFSQANQFLIDNDLSPIDWQIT